MSEPNQGGPPADQPKGGPPAEQPKGKGGKDTPPAPERLAVVEFIHADPVDRLPYRGIGVVVDVDDQAVTVRPLAGHRLRLPAADVAVLAADDSGEV